MALILISGRARALRMTVAGLVACCMLIGLCNNSFWPTQHKPDWRALVRDADPTLADAPMLVTAPHASPLGIAFYADGPIRTPVRQWVPAPETAVSTADRLTDTVIDAPAMSTGQLVDAVRAGRHLRLILDSDDNALIAGVLAKLPEFASAQRAVYPGLQIFSW